MKIIIAVFALCAFNIACAATITGRVVGVTDGDTITILDASHTHYKVRLAGIDASEKRQDFGSASKKSLSDLVFDKQVTVDWSKEDHYGRVIGKGTCLGVILICNRLNWHGVVL